MLELSDSKPLVESNFDDIVSIIHSLLQSDSYVARRQSLKILRDITSDEDALLQRYIAVGDHLKIHMNLLRDKSKSIAYESFLIFQVNGSNSLPYIVLCHKGASQ